MINEFETTKMETKNYKEYKEAMKNISIVDICVLIDYIEKLSIYIPENDHIFDNFYDIINPFERIINKIKTNKICPHCKSYLFKSDLPQYDYVCQNCNENFYECEVK